jgi:hypothetical protein
MHENGRIRAITRRTVRVYAVLSAETEKAIETTRLAAVSSRGERYRGEHRQLSRRT